MKHLFVIEGKTYTFTDALQDIPCRCKGCVAEFDAILCSKLPNDCLSRKLIFILQDEIPAD